MRKLLQPEIRKATSKARNTSKSVFNIWLNERKILKARQVPAVTVQQTNRAACPSHLLSTRQRPPRKEPSVNSSNSAGLDQPSISCVSTHDSSHGNYFKGRVVSTTRAQKRGSHIWAVEVACELKPVPFPASPGYSRKPSPGEPHHCLGVGRFSTPSCPQCCTKFELVITDLSMV